MFRGKNVFVLGDGNFVFEEVLYLILFIDKIILIIRSDKFYVEDIIVEKVKVELRIIFILNIYIKSLEGNEFVEKINLIGKDGKIIILDCDGLFLMIGFIFILEFVKDLNIINEKGYIKINEKM